MKNSIFTILLSLLVLWGCNNAPATLTNAEKEQIESEVKNEFLNLVQSIKDLDYESWSGHISDDDFIASLSRYFGYIPSHDDWMRIVKDSYEIRDKHESQTLDLSVTALSSTLAVLTFNGVWENWWDDKYMKVNGMATYLWKKENDGWKVILSQECSKPALDIIGSWNFIEIKGSDNGDPYNISIESAGGSRIKMWSNTHFLFVGQIIDENGNIIDRSGGGTYSLDGKRYIENVRYNFNKAYEGATVEMRLEIKGDTLIQTYPVDADGNIDKDNYAIEKYVRLD